jgi:hypothetical protein
MKMYFVLIHPLHGQCSVCIAGTQILITVKFKRKKKLSAACTGKTPMTDSLALLNEKPQLREKSVRSIAWWHYF